MPSCLPALQGARIDPQPNRHLSLRQAERPAFGGKAGRERISGGLWVIPQELDDGRNVSNRRTGCVAFPVSNRGRVDADAFANLPLEEVEV